MKPLAVIVPIHPPKFSFAQELVQSFDSAHVHDQMDLYLVFSNESDQKAWNMPLPIGVHTLCLNWHGPTETIITMKKLLALKQLVQEQRYQYYIVFDAETRWIADAPWHHFIQDLEHFYSQKCWHASPILSNDFRSIITCSASCLRDVPFAQLPTLYSWFHDIPVYFAQDLDQFFQQLDMDKIQHFFCFDHLIYQLFLVMFRGWSLHALPFTLELCEPFAYEAFHHSPLWIHHKRFTPTFPMRVYFTFHHDR